ncbi:hypothetical protein EMGBS15_01470 [Filimonas sp.]|nr:hypothetical protein EMGBS15_01470 [Filimonas sp.]
MKQFSLLMFFILLRLSSFSQAPSFMSYQSVIRNTSNMLIINTPVRIRVSILQGSSSGSAVYVETHTPTTNPNGLAICQSVPVRWCRVVFRLLTGPTAPIS